jgi:hypothetical protein
MDCNVSDRLLPFPILVLFPDPLGCRLCRSEANVDAGVFATPSYETWAMNLFGANSFRAVHENPFVRRCR